MTAIREYGLVLVLATASAATLAQSFEQHGPTGDNRAATGNPGTQQPPTENSKAAAKKKQPMKDERRGTPNRQQILTPLRQLLHLALRQRTMPSLIPQSKTADCYLLAELIISN